MEAQEGQLQMTITVTRKETGKVEEYVVTSIPEEKESNSSEPEEIKENE